MPESLLPAVGRFDGDDPRQGQLLGQDSNIGGALDEDVISREQRVILRDARRQVFEELFTALDPAFGQIVVDAADGDVAIG